MDQPELREVAANIFGYIQPDGSWGLSNAGLVVTAESTLLVDTLFDYAYTRRMLDTMRGIGALARPIDIVVNTHANGDHCYGNALVKGSRIIASDATMREMSEMPPQKLAKLMAAARALVALGPARGPLGALLRSVKLTKAAHLFEAAPYVVKAFDKFDFRGVELTEPTETFKDELSLKVGNRDVELIKVGPAHTEGDIIAYVPDARVVFAGDVLFVGHHPLIWAGSITDAINACERILALDVDVIVPGHGPITDRAGVSDQIAYLRSLLREVRDMIADGVPESEATVRLMKAGFGSRGLPERLAVNVHAAYCELGGQKKHDDVIALFARMGRLIEIGSD